VLEAAMGCFEAYCEFAMKKLGAGRITRKVALAS